MVGAGPQDDAEVVAPPRRDEVLAPEPMTEAMPEPAPEPAHESGAPARMALEPEADTVAAPQPVPQPSPVPLPGRRGGATLAIAWALSLLVVAGALAALAIGRERVMAAWPPSTRAYVALGLAPRG